MDFDLTFYLLHCLFVMIFLSVLVGRKLLRLNVFVYEFESQETCFGFVYVTCFLTYLHESWRLKQMKHLA